MPHSSSHSASRRGSVLAGVLAMVILLSFLVVAFMTDVKDKLRYHAQFQYQDDLRVEAYSALETTLAVLNTFREIDSALWGPLQGWGNPLELAGFEIPPGMRIDVQFHDESGKFPLNTTEFATFRLLFDELEIAPRDAEEVADSILDWIDEDDLPRLNGFDGDDYRRLRPTGYEPANQPIRTWDELALIPAFRRIFYDENGAPNHLYREFRQSFSLTHDGPVNLNSASWLVQRVLERQGVLQPDNLSVYREGPDRELGTEDDRPITNLERGGILAGGESTGVTTEIAQLEVSVRVSRGEANFLLRTLVSWRGANPSAGTVGGARTNRRDPGSAAATEGARTRGGGETDPTLRARGNTRTDASPAAQLGHPFQIFWITENQQN